jgi:hypothetical protein
MNRLRLSRKCEASLKKRSEQPSGQKGAEEQDAESHTFLVLPVGVCSYRAAVLIR